LPENAHLKREARIEEERFAQIHRGDAAGKLPCAKRNPRAMTSEKSLSKKRDVRSVVQKKGG